MSDMHLGTESSVARCARADRVVLASFMLAGVVGVLKGLTPTLRSDFEFYWLISYRYGFIRRGRIGTLVAPFLKWSSLANLKTVVVGAHVVGCLAIIVVLQALVGRAIRAEQRLEVRVTLACSFLLLMCCQLMPVVAHETGSVDTYLIGLVLAGLWLTLGERVGAAALVAVVGPLVHEAFIFLWSPVAILLLW